MNIYIVTEGRSEAIIYKYWIPLINSQLTYINDLSLFEHNNYFIVSGKGFPDYYSIIDNAIEDINMLGNIDKLILAVDSEDMTKEEKYSEIFEFISGKPCLATIIIVIQHFCIEAWALGNRKFFREHPTNDRLLAYKRKYDVKINDPELLPPLEEESMNRSQFAEIYLKLAINDRNSKLSYSKKRPYVVAHNKYFPQLCRRINETNHISSMKSFIEAFN